MSPNPDSYYLVTVSPSDEARVDEFEQLVQSQKPATEPWQPVTDYSFEGRRQLEEPHAQLIKDVLKPHTVLDYGCGFGHLVRLLRKRGIHATGYDPNLRDTEHEDNIGTSHKYIAALYAYDVVICREVFEHLTIRELVQAVRDCVSMSSRLIYCTTRFAKSATHLLDVDTSDDLDPTHITMATKSFLRLLFVLEGCKRRDDLEERMDWMKKGRVLVYEVASTTTSR